jgi:hypothetical protein
MAQRFWAYGPAEILQQALSLLKNDTEANRRLALLAIDDAVALIIKTYLGLPKRTTGTSLSRKRYREISENLPALLETLTANANDRLDGLFTADLRYGVFANDLERYHSLKDQLYTKGRSLTVKRDQVVVYAELARLLFRDLFGTELQREPAFARFMTAWLKLEKVWKLLIKQSGKFHGRIPLSPGFAFERLHQLGLISGFTQRELVSLRRIRDEVVIGRTGISIITPDTVERLTSITRRLEQKLSKDEIISIEAS